MGFFLRTCGSKECYFSDDRRHNSFMWNKATFGLMRPAMNYSWEGLSSSDLKFSNSNGKEVWMKPANGKCLVGGQMLHLGCQNGSPYNTNLNPYLTLSHDVDGLLERTTGKFIFHFILFYF